ncbi:MAG TPA: dihydropteroate synthase, partial [Candidatus Sulfotelmatobacter sp.]|nr:dihydropteroate synthase [Candidatus Sulfotelmatobacter sp.]
MKPRVIGLPDLTAAREEMLAIGCDRPGAAIMGPKAVQRALKITGIKPVAANILKQEILSYGGDAATAYGAIDHSVKQTDIILFGSLKQLALLTKKLARHQFGLPGLARQIDRALRDHEATPGPMKIGPKVFTFGRRTYLMGILNVTPDSFSDGGEYFNTAAAIARGRELIAAGADIIDIGGESTRPGARPVPAALEIRRVVPVIRELAGNKKTVISIDTQKAAVAAAALNAGADLVNDVSGLRADKKMAKLLARRRAPVCLMHMKGEPRTMQKNPTYSDLMGEIIGRLAESIAIANNAGILLEKILIDPGFGFGKTVEHNLEILRRLRELKTLARPIVIGTSRKSTIGRVLGLPAGERVEGTAATVALAIAGGA